VESIREAKDVKSWSDEEEREKKENNKKQKQ
jgi:hypothetical protein